MSRLKLANLDLVCPWFEYFSRLILYFLPFLSHHRATVFTEHHRQSVSQPFFIVSQSRS